jgi:hypothetical protein
LVGVVGVVGVVGLAGVAGAAGSVGAAQATISGIATNIASKQMLPSKIANFFFVIQSS